MRVAALLLCTGTVSSHLHPMAYPLAFTTACVFLSRCNYTIGRLLLSNCTLVVGVAAVVAVAFLELAALVSEVIPP